MTHHAMNDDEARIKVREMLEKITTVMLVTHEPGGGMHARPMHIIALEDDVLWFFTEADSPKGVAIAGDQDVLIAASNPSRQEYVSVTGQARLLRDPAKQAALWTELARPWFPEGAASANLALIRVAMRGAEFWDSPSSVALFAWGYVQSVVTGAAPDEGETGKVRFA